MIKIFKEDVDITQDVCEALYSNVRNIGVKVEVANKLTLTGLEIIQCDVEQQILTEDKFNLGTANCSTCELVINNIGEPYDPKFFIGQEIKVYYTLTTAKGDYVEIPMGIFIVDTAIRNTNKIKINAYDRVLLTEENYNTKTTLEYPTTLKQIAKDACEISKVYFSDADFFNSDLVYTDMVVFGADTTCRNVLQNVAEMACGYLKSNRDGMLYIHSLDTETIVDTIYPKNYFKLDQLEQQFGPLKSVYMVYDEDDALYGEGSPQLQVRNNYYIPKKFEHLPKKMFDYIGHINYCPATLEWQGNPLFDAGDFINVVDKKGNTNKLLITSQKFSYNGGLKCTLKSVGKSDVALATEKKNVISEAIEGLNRRLNALKTKIDKAELDMLMTQIDEFSGRLDGLIKEFKEVQINVTPDGIVNTVTNSKTYQDYLDGIYDGLNGLQGQVVTMESVISQHADQINMSVKGDNIISYINLDKSGVQIRGDKIQLQGVVTFEDLSGDGKTVINGSNITTGTISGDIIKGGTIEGINIKGENIDVTARLDIYPAENPTYGNSLGYAYPDPNNSGEWATIDFNVKGDNSGTVNLKTFPYVDAEDPEELGHPKDWKYGLEVNGALKANDTIIVQGEDGIYTKMLRTPMIKLTGHRNDATAGKIETSGAMDGARITLRGNDVLQKAEVMHNDYPYPNFYTHVFNSSGGYRFDLGGNITPYEKAYSKYPVGMNCPPIILRKSYNHNNQCLIASEDGAAIKFVHENRCVTVDPNPDNIISPHNDINSYVPIQARSFTAIVPSTGFQRDFGFVLCRAIEPGFREYDDNGNEINEINNMVLKTYQQSLHGGIDNVNSGNAGNRYPVMSSITYHSCNTDQRQSSGKVFCTIDRVHCPALDFSGHYDESIDGKVIKAEEIVVSSNIHNYKTSFIPVVSPRGNFRAWWTGNIRVSNLRSHNRFFTFEIEIEYTGTTVGEQSIIDISVCSDVVNLK